MPRLSGSLQPTGALVAVEVGLTRFDILNLRKAGRPIPAPVSLQTLLDTGAECSCVDRHALASLALPLRLIGLANMPAIGGLVPTTEYNAKLTIIHPSGDPQLNLVIPAVSLAEVPLGSLGYEVLIGRDVLAQCRFLYDGPRSRFRLSY
jgi:hypothetical protein